MTDVLQERVVKVIIEPIILSINMLMLQYLIYNKMKCQCKKMNVFNDEFSEW